MVNVNNFATPCFWNCTGLGIAILSIGMSINISRTKTMEFQLAEYKLKTTNAISEVQKAATHLEAAAEVAPLSLPAQRKIKRELSESNQTLTEAIDLVESETDKLINTEIDK